MGSTKSRTTRTARNQRSVVMLAVIAVVIVAIVAGLYFYMDWQNNRPGTPPQEIEVTARAGESGDKVSTMPFSICEFGQECPEGDVALLPVEPGTENVRVSVPNDVAQLQWSLLSIYDDPAANTERTFTPGEADEVDVPVVSEDANLVVIEVSALMVGTDEQGEETPVVVTWAFTTEAS